MRVDPLLRALHAIAQAKLALQTAEREIADAIVMQGDRRDIAAVMQDDEYTASMGRCPRFEEPSHDAPAVPCMDYRAEREFNAAPECHTHDCAIPDAFEQRVLECGE